jgi:hypothetical protein
MDSPRVLRGHITSRWKRPGVRRDLQAMEQFCNLGEQELEKSQAPPRPDECMKDQWLL